MFVLILLSLCPQLPTQNPTHDWMKIWWETDQEQCWMQWMTLLGSTDHKVFQLEYRNVSFKEVHLRRCAVQLTFLEARVQSWSSNWHFLSQELILEFTPFTRARLCRLLSNWALAQASKYLFLVTAYLLTAGANIPPFVQLFFLTTLKLSGCREDSIPLPHNPWYKGNKQPTLPSWQWVPYLGICFWGFYFEDWTPSTRLVGTTGSDIFHMASQHEAFEAIWLLSHLIHLTWAVCNVLPVPEYS